jgi:hypothetical protein
MNVKIKNVFTPNLSDMFRSIFIIFIEFLNINKAYMNILNLKFDQTSFKRAPNITPEIAKPQLCYAKQSTFSDSRYLEENRRINTVQKPR